MIILFHLQCFDRKEDSPPSFSLPSFVEMGQKPYQNGQKRSGSDRSPELSSSSKRTKLHCLEGKIQKCLMRNMQTTKPYIYSLQIKQLI